MKSQSTRIAGVLFQTFNFIVTGEAHSNRPPWNSKEAFQREMVTEIHVDESSSAELGAMMNDKMIHMDIILCLLKFKKLF